MIKFWIILKKFNYFKEHPFWFQTGLPNGTTSEKRESSQQKSKIKIEEKKIDLKKE